MDGRVGGRCMSGCAWKELDGSGISEGDCRGIG